MDPNNNVIKYTTAAVSEVSFVKEPKVDPKAKGSKKKDKDEDD